MKIFFISTHNIECSQAVYTAHLGKELQKLGHDITILAEDMHDDFNDTNYSNIPYIRCWNRYSGNYLKIKEIIKNDKPDIVHFQLEYGLWQFEQELTELTQWIKSRGIKVFLTFHSQLPIGKGFEWVYEMCFDIDGVVTFGKGGVDELYMIGVENAVHIPYGVISLKEFPALVGKEKARKKLGLPKNKIIILTEGFINEGSRIVENVWAIKELNNKNIHYVVAGLPIVINNNNWNEIYYDRIEMAKKQSGIDMTLVKKYLNPEEISLYYEAADFILLNFCKTVWTSTLCINLVRTFEKPSITTTSLICDNLSSEESLKVEYDNQEELIEALKTIINDFDMINKEHLESMRKSQSKYLFENIAKEHNDFYNNSFRA